MPSKEEIETCKEELNNYIEFMETAGDNAGWARYLKWYIEQLEHKIQVKDEAIKEQGQVIKDMCSEKKEVIEKMEKRRDKNNTRYGQSIEDDEFPEMYNYGGQVEEDNYILKLLKGAKC